MRNHLAILEKNISGYLEKKIPEGTFTRIPVLQVRNVVDKPGKGKARGNKKEQRGDTMTESLASQNGFKKQAKNTPEETCPNKTNSP